MSTDPAPAASPERGVRTPFRSGVDLFLISLLILFLELACIRWFPAHVLFLTFFTNVVLLACFVGMSVGCLAAGQGVDKLHAALEHHINVGGQDKPQEVFFGTEYHSSDEGFFRIPIELI